MPGSSLNLAGIVKIIFGRFKNGPGNIAMKRGNLKNDIERFQYRQPSLDGLVRTLKILRQRAVRYRTSDFFLQKLNQGFDGCYLLHIFEIDQILLQNDVQMAPFPAIVIGFIILKIGFRKSADL